MPWDFNSNEPIYQQIVKIIITKLINSELKPGDRLQSTRDLAIDAGVNLNTAQRAYSELEKRSIIFTQRGNGRFVVDDENLIVKLKGDTVKDEVEKFYNKMLDMGISTEEVIKIIKDISGVR